MLSLTPLQFNQLIIYLINMKSYAHHNQLHFLPRLASSLSLEQHSLLDLHHPTLQAKATRIRWHNTFSIERHRSKTGLMRFKREKINRSSLNPGGTIIICQSQKIELFQTNVAFAQGIHFWEFQAPLSCVGLVFGLLQKNPDQSIAHQEIFQFNTSSSRKISFKGDFDRGQLKCWLNYQTPSEMNKFRTIGKGVWTPFVRLKSKGVIVAINQYPPDPQDKIKPRNLFNATQPLAKIDKFQAPKLGLPGQKKIDFKKSIQADDCTIVFYNQDSFKVIKRLGFNNLSTHILADRDWLQLAISKQDYQVLLQFLETSLVVASFESFDYNQFVGMRMSVKQWQELLGTILFLFGTEHKLCFLKQQLIQKLVYEKVQQVRYFSQRSIRPIPKSEKPSEQWYINSLPPVKIQNKIIRLFAQNSMVLIQTEAGHQLWSVQSCSVLLWQGHIKHAYHRPNYYLKQNKPLNQDPNFSVNSPHLFKILQNCLKQAKIIKNLPKFQISEQKPQGRKKPVITLQQCPFLDKLTAMGFSIQACRRAIDQKANQSFETMVQYLIALPPEQKKKPPRAWVCNVCTIINYQCQFCTVCVNQYNAQCQQHIQSQPQSQPKNQVEVQKKSTNNQYTPTQEIVEQIQSVRIVRESRGTIPLYILAVFRDRLRIIPLSPDGLVLQNLYYKEEKGFVQHETNSFISSLNQLDNTSTSSFYPVNLQSIKWIIIDQKDLFLEKIQDVYLGREGQLRRLYVLGQKLTTFNFSIKQQSSDFNQSLIQLSVIHQRQLKQGSQSLQLSSGRIYQVAPQAYSLVGNAMSQLHNSIALRDKFITDLDLLPSLNATNFDGKSKILTIWHKIAYEQQIPSRPESVLENSDGDYLPMLPVSAPPGCSLYYTQSNILFPQKPSFLANYVSPFTLRHLHDKLMVIRKVIIERSNSRQVRGVQSGCIVVGKSRTCFKFQQGSSSAIVEIGHKEAQSELILQLNFQREPVLAPFQIMFIGVKGFSVQHFNNSEKEGLSPLTLALLDKGLTLKSLSDSSPQTLTAFCNVNQSYFSLGKQVSIQKASTLFKQNIQVYLKIQLQTKQSMGISSVADSRVSSIREGSKEQSLWQQESEISVQKLIERYNGGELCRIQQSKVLKLLSALLKIYPQKKKWALSKLDFIRTIHYSHNSFQLFTAKDQGFNSKVGQTLQQLLLTLFQLKGWSHSLQKKLFSLIELASAEIRSNLLPSIQNCLNKFLIQRKSLQISDSQQSSKNYQRLYQAPLINARFSLSKSKFSRRFFIDLGNVCQLQYFTLNFAKGNGCNKLRVQLHSLMPTSKGTLKQTLIDQKFGQSAWLQLSRVPYNKEIRKLYVDPLGSGLNTMGFRLQSKSRELLLQLTYTFRTDIASEREHDQLCNCQIIPQFFGQQTKQERELTSGYCQLFSAINQSLFYTSQVRISNISPVYLKKSVNRDNREFTHFSIKSFTTFQEKKQKSLDEMCACLLALLYNHKLGLQNTLLIWQSCLDLNTQFSQRSKQPLNSQLQQLSDQQVEQLVQRLVSKGLCPYFKGLILNQTQFKKVFDCDRKNSLMLKLLLAVRELSPQTKLQVLVFLQDSKVQEYQLEIIKKCLSKQLTEQQTLILKNIVFKILRSEKLEHKSKIVQLLLTLSQQVRSQIISSYLDQAILSKSQSLDFQFLLSVLSLIQTYKSKPLHLCFGAKLINFFQKPNHMKYQLSLWSIVLSILKLSIYSQDSASLLQKVLMKFVDSKLSVKKTIYHEVNSILTQFLFSAKKRVESIVLKTVVLLFKQLKEHEHSHIEILISLIDLLYQNIHKISSQKIKRTVFQSSQLIEFKSVFAAYLTEQVNFGGLDGVLFVDETKLQKLQLSEYMSRLVMPGRQASDACSGMQLLLEWYLLNYQQSMKSISSQGQELLQRILKNIINYFIRLKFTCPSQQLTSLFILTLNKLRKTVRGVIAVKVFKAASHLQSTLFNSKLHLKQFARQLLPYMLDQLSNQTSTNQNSMQSLKQVKLSGKVSNLSNAPKCLFQLKAPPNLTNQFLQLNFVGQHYLQQHISIDLSKPSFLTRLVLGVNNDSSFPSNIACFLSSDGSTFAYAGQLERFRDRFFNSNGSTCFALNFLSLNNIDSLQLNPSPSAVKCIKLVLTRPYSCTLSPILNTQAKQGPVVNINMIYLLGSQQPMMQCNWLQQLSYSMLERFVHSGSLQDIFIANKQLIKTAIPNICKRLEVIQFKVKTKKIILSLATYDSDLMACFIQELQNHVNQDSSQLLLKLIMTDQKRTEERLKALIQSTIKKLTSKNLNEQSHLLRDISQVINITRYHKSFQVQISQEQTKQLLSIYKQINEDCSFNGFVSFLTVCLPVSIIDAIWAQKIIYFRLVQSLSLKKDGFTFIQKLMPQLYEQICDSIKNSTNQQDLSKMMGILSAMCVNKSGLAFLHKNQFHSNIFELVRSSKKQLDKKIARKIVDILILCSQIDRAQISVFIKQILLDCTVNPNPFIIENFVWPLLSNFQSELVCIIPFDMQQNRILQSVNQALESNPLVLKPVKQLTQSKFQSPLVQRLIRQTQNVSDSKYSNLTKLDLVRYNLVAYLQLIDSQEMLILTISSQEHSHNKLSYVLCKSKGVLKLHSQGRISVQVQVQYDQQQDLLTLSDSKGCKVLVLDSDRRIVKKYGESCDEQISCLQEIHGQNSENTSMTELMFSLCTVKHFEDKFQYAGPLQNHFSHSLYRLPKSLTAKQLLQNISFAGLVLKPEKSSEASLKTIEGRELQAFQKICDLSEGNPRVLLLRVDTNQILTSKMLEMSQRRSSQLEIQDIKILKQFQQTDGIQLMIQVLCKSIDKWTNKKMKDVWLQYINQLKCFSSLPSFFAVFMKHKNNIDLLMDLLVGRPNSSTQTGKWQEQQKIATKLIYDVLSQVFVVDQSQEIRRFAVQNCFIQRILQRLSIISKESGRKWNPVLEEEKPLSIAKPQEKQSKSNIKKKGVGYGNQTNGDNSWQNRDNSAQKVRSAEIQNILSILQNFLRLRNWQPPKNLMVALCQSSLLPLMQSCLRCGSLLQLSKDFDLFKAYTKIIRILSDNESFKICLQRLDKRYVPAQFQSITSLLQKLNSTSTIFMSCLNKNKAQTKQNNLSQQIAQEIIATYQHVLFNVNSSENNEANFNKILALPLKDLYPALLKNLRFGYTSFKEGSYKHHYSSCIGTNVNPPTNKIVRLSQQLAQMSNSLPIESTNSIFVRCDNQRVDVIKAVIMGSQDTPYSGGAFLFDIFVQDSYPSGPPKMNLTTTGSGRIRFNPNLYSCGKVCLSLLGTWRGSAIQSWDPKISSIMQVLISTQAMIMSELVYFNEPGFQSQMNTDAGDKKNEAYSNIVRYGNIKFAMIDNMKSPPKGFQTVIKRHFWAKRQSILVQVNKWLKWADSKQANYVSLVCDHNISWCNQFKKSKTKYKQMLAEAIKQLQVELNKLQKPNLADDKLLKSQKKIKKKQQKQTISIKGNELAVDVNYDNSKEIVVKELNVDDAQVQDRWSRYIGAMGIQAVKKQAKAKILLSGLGPLGIQIAKNIVLSGCQSLTLLDDQACSVKDLLGQFFLSQNDIGKQRLSCCLHKLQQLNVYVKLNQAKNYQNLKQYDVVILTDSDFKTSQQINLRCREDKVKFISCKVQGLFGYTFNDFSDQFTVLDKNGQECPQMYVKSISNDEHGLVRLLQGSKHGFEEGDSVLIQKVQGMKTKDLKGSINEKVLKVKKVINTTTFEVGELSDFEAYIRNGTVKGIKSPLDIAFRSLKSQLQQGPVQFQSNLIYADYLKDGHNKYILRLFQALQKFRELEGRSPRAWDLADSELIYSKYYVSLYKQLKEPENPKEKQQIIKQKDYQKQLCFLFSATSEGSFPPLSAYFGGVVSQEAFKAITQKFTPIKGFYCHDAVQVCPFYGKQISPQDLQKFYTKTGDRTQPLRVIFGDQGFKKISQSKIFMVGAGAIGCQLLKNLAMVGLASGKNGKIFVTDPDHIQTSNLNRQFLFREKHISKPKSLVAAASVVNMNPALKDHVIALLQKVHEGTKNIFTDKFFKELSLVANALDNVQARRYVDKRCVANHIPLLQSGTLGPKGHVQVVVPNLTQSYGSKNDPVQQGQIPHCTLKMFPEQTLHCVEWARDKFGKVFDLRVKGAVKILQDQAYLPTQSDQKTLRQSLKIVQNRPLDFQDCCKFAVRKFYKYFRNDILQLVHTYPLDFKTKDGQPFWKLPKRPPVPVQRFNPQQALHLKFMISLAVLRAKVYNIKVPKDIRSPEIQVQFGHIGKNYPIPDFHPSDKKSKEISQKVNKQPQSQETNNDSQLFSTLFKDLKTAVSKLGKMNFTPQEFQKDDDSNGHIDYIHALANLRAVNYSLDPMDFITVKLKAGRIVPALSTTTTCIAALQTIQLIKVLRESALKDYKNAFLNLAVPILSLSQPGQAQKFKIHDKLFFNIWDVWTIRINKDSTLHALFSQLKQTYALEAIDLFLGSQPIFLRKLYENNQSQLKSKLDARLLDLIQMDSSKEVDMTVIFKDPADPNKILNSTPTVRLSLQ